MSDEDEPNVTEDEDGCLTITPGGDWEWHGIFVPEGTNSPDGQSEFTVFANDMEQAVKFANETLPERIEIVYLSRGASTKGMSTKLDKEKSAALMARMKRTMN